MSLTHSAHKYSVQGWVRKCEGSNSAGVISYVFLSLMGCSHCEGISFILSISCTYKLIKVMLMVSASFFGSLKRKEVLRIGQRSWRTCGNTEQATVKQHTHMQITRLVDTLISVFHHPGNYTHSFLFTQGTCWGLPPPRASDGISCGVGKIIVGISKKRDVE